MTSTCLWFIVCLGIALSILQVNGEVCTVNSDCIGTTCVTKDDAICQHQDPTAGIIDGAGLCTCADRTSVCLDMYDCFRDKAPTLTCHDTMRHCLDGTCICDKFGV